MHGKAVAHPRKVATELTEAWRCAFPNSEWGFQDFTLGSVFSQAEAALAEIEAEPEEADEEEEVPEEDPSDMNGRRRIPKLFVTQEPVAEGGEVDEDHSKCG